MKLNSRLNVLKFLFYRNDVVWNQLENDVKAKIIKNNSTHNSDREDYATPLLYGTKRLEGGEVWENPAERTKSDRGRFIANLFIKSKPASILEIGPGGGFFTKFYCEQQSTKKYVAVEISKGFVEYLKTKLQELKSARSDFDFEVLHGSAPSVLPKNEQFDFIVLSSVVHHIPNRKDLFDELSKLLKPNGILVCVDPSHYLARIITLSKKCLKGSYIGRGFDPNANEWSTHHFCTYGEYKKIIEDSKNFEIVEEYYHVNKKFKFIKNIFPRMSSDEIGIVFKKLS